MHKSLFLFIILAIALSFPAAAQDYGLGGMDSYISASNSNILTTNTIIGNATFRSSLKSKVNSRKAASQPTKAQTVASAAALSFKPSAAVRKQSKDRFFAIMRSSDPDGARVMEEHFGNFQGLDQALAEYGLRSDNVADVMTVWMINMWMGANGISDDPPNAHIKAVRTQIADALRASPGLASASDAQKQELSDSLLLNAALIGSALGDPKFKSGEMRAPLQKAMAKVGSSMGMDLTAMRVTSAGFVG
jgi:hypothetical protein